MAISMNDKEYFKKLAWVEFSEVFSEKTQSKYGEDILTGCVKFGKSSLGIINVLEYPLFREYGVNTISIAHYNSSLSFDNYNKLYHIKTLLTYTDSDVFLFDIVGDYSKEYYDDVFSVSWKSVPIRVVKLIPSEFWYIHESVYQKYKMAGIL